MIDLYKKTLKAYDSHGTIIVGVEFDDTVFPYTPSTKERCEIVVEQLKKLKNNYNVTLCLFTVSDKSSLKYKEHIMDLYGIKPDFINESPIKNWVICPSTYFNIYIDDKSGIDEMIHLLKMLNNK
ncbi:hypothetical protein HYO65_gp129 [Tenacibaculum phage PTm1]|uniref:Uncharacterized protein n=2 Tax=Shirahamavirus PTm1 TaxID=2846435 RepID=A0A5S9ERK5_9CAUD|nr:hypothetical protein HYO65_gp129 [Tenacibaculum phage PTm1]BBI90521.1 hypothetical protein [Tenacibaculum phage PTm1]BBI90829.1 hypothetical protein [Tenacibaculum phage PTm5]